MEVLKSSSQKQSLFTNSRVYILAFTAYWGIFLFGYDTGVAGSVVAQDGFQRAFGTAGTSATQKQRQADLAANVVSVLQAGAFFGALGSAPLSAAVGRRWSLLLWSLLFSVGAALQTAAKAGQLSYIYGGRVVAGIGVGAISAVAPAFVSECSPKEIRGRVTGQFQVMVATGVMVSYFINYGITLHIPDGPQIWRIPFGFQLVPAGIMCLGLLLVKESPRWLASKGRHEEALHNLAYLRKLEVDDPAVGAEYAEIEAAIEEEARAREGLGWKEAFFGKGNFIRFVIAFFMFLLQQWSGQNSVAYYAPQIFQAIGFTGNTKSLLASGLYGVIKVIATAVFIWFGIDRVGRKISLSVSALGMGTLFFIVGAILKTHPTTSTTVVGSAQKAMAAMLYIYACFYSFGWGPTCWIYVSDIFPTRTRHYGLAVASATQWLFNFVVAKVTPTLELKLVANLFFMFATINIGGMFVFSLLLPETKGRSLEEMDIIFGSVSREAREVDIQKAQQTIAADFQGHHGAPASTTGDNASSDAAASKEKV